MMHENTGRNIVNMIECRSGEHVLFRSFGLGGVTDGPNRFTRGTLQVAVNKWFPSTVIDSISIKNASISGNFIYDIKVRGL